MVPLAESGFPDDDGRADEALAAVLAHHSRMPDEASVLAALCRSRLLVPVVAVGAPEADRTEAGHDRQAEMSAVLLRGRDDRTALLAFTSLEHLTSWRAAARPVPVPASEAARAAVAEGASALLVDVAGPVPFVVVGDDLDQLAAGHRLVPTGTGHAWAAPVG